MLLDLGLDPNHANTDGRTALMGAALKGRNDVVQLLVDRGAKLDDPRQGQPRHGSRPARSRPVTRGRRSTTRRVSFGSACRCRGAHPETAALIRKLMAERGLQVPPPNRAFETICRDVLCED